MANPYNSDVSQQNRSGGSGHRERPAAKGQGTLRYRTAPWPAAPGKTGPKRNTTGVKRVAQYPASKGL